MTISRRGFVQLAGASALMPSQIIRETLRTSHTVDLPQPSLPRGISKVALVHGEDRRRNIRAALELIDDQIRPRLRNKKYVVIKPNNVSTTNQLAATHVDAMHGILDYLEPRFRGPVIIAESSAGDTLDAFDHFHYNRLVAEHRSQKFSLIDLNREGKFQTIPLLDADLHITPVRLAARVLDPQHLRHLQRHAQDA